MPIFYLLYANILRVFNNTNFVFILSKLLSSLELFLRLYCRSIHGKCCFLDLYIKSHFCIDHTWTCFKFFKVQKVWTKKSGLSPSLPRSKYTSRDGLYMWSVYVLRIICNILKLFFTETYIPASFPHCYRKCCLICSNGCVVLYHGYFIIYVTGPYWQTFRLFPIFCCSVSNEDTCTNIPLYVSKV